MKIKTIVLGDRASGKTTLLSHLDTRLRTKDYIPTIGVDFVSYSKSGTTLHIWDTSGSSRFNSVIRPFVRDIHLAIIVYNSQRSYDKINMYIEWVETLCNRDYRIIIVSLCTDVELEINGQYLANSRNVMFLTTNAMNRTSSLAFWNDLMYFCDCEINRRTWNIKSVEEEKREKDESTNRTNSYRLCWWI